MLTVQLCNREATLSGPVRVGSLGMACQDSRSNPFSGAPLLGSGLIAAWAVGSGQPQPACIPRAASRAHSGSGTGTGPAGRARGGRRARATPSPTCAECSPRSAR
jgi:hypothetical protein